MKAPLSPDQFDVLKLARMHGMIERTLVELRETPDLDAATVARVESLVQRTLVQIGSAVPDELMHELGRVIGSAGEGSTPNELRVIEAQMLGWLRGVAGAERLEDLREQIAGDRDRLATENGAHDPPARGGYL